MSIRVGNTSTEKAKTVAYLHAHRTGQLKQPLRTNGYSAKENNQLTVVRGTELLLKLKLRGHLGQETFERVSQGFSSNLKEFFGITRDGKLEISEDELRRKIHFAEKLIKLPPNNLSNIDFREEYNAYQIYESSSHTGFKRFADEFVQAVGDPALDNYKTRMMIISFLHLRSRAHDKRKAKIFLENLITLKIKYDVDGIDRLLKSALKNERASSFGSRMSTPHGFYRHAEVALNLTRKPNLKVESLSAVEVEFFDKPFSIPRIIGDIDIVATDGNKTYLTEVKTSAYAVFRDEDKGQIDTLVELANEIDAIPVLLLGRVETPDLNDLRKYKPVERRDRVLRDIGNLVDLINRYNGKLQIWDKNGDNITKKLLRYQKKPAILAE